MDLRSAEVADCASIWEWARDPATRQASLRPEPITWEGHQTWFMERLADPKARYYVAVSQEQLIGEIRFDLDEQQAIVSVTLSPLQRGQGHAATLIRLGVEQLVRETDVILIRAFIKPNNVASVKAFLSAGFEEWEAAILLEQPVLCFAWERETNLDSIDH